MSINANHRSVVPQYIAEVYCEGRSIFGYERPLPHEIPSAALRILKFPFGKGYFEPAEVAKEGSIAGSIVIDGLVYRYHFTPEENQGGIKQ